MRRAPVSTRWLVAALAASLGFAFVVQVRTTRGESALAGARQEDLVRILDDLTARTDRLRGEITDLERTRERLTSGFGREDAALAEARKRADALGILAGTVAAEGPGVTVEIRDPEHTVTADVLLDALQELRDAGAEAIQLNGVRLVASSYLIDPAGSPGSVEVDANRVAPPYRFVAIGDADTLAEAMGIPGGVIDTVGSRAGARAIVTPRARLVVTALRPLSSGS
ncbi:MAG: DUF881 domain-containing protein [Mycobacteriales bacterium]|nr:DUF881 domain-containing protein [Frankia sp.]